MAESKTVAVLVITQLNRGLKAKDKHAPGSHAKLPADEAKRLAARGIVKIVDAKTAAAAKAEVDEAAKAHDADKAALAESEIAVKKLSDKVAELITANEALVKEVADLTAPNK